MKFLRLIFFLILASSMLSGCLKRKNKDGSYLGGKDTPLQEFPLDSFYEATGEESNILRDITFDYNRSEIKPSEKAILTPMIDWLKSNESYHLLIEGHCDERGSNEYNLALGEQRALNVRQYFIDNGINSYRLQTISYGEEKPVDAGHDETAWNKNRRAHFLISKG